MEFSSISSRFRLFIVSLFLSVCFVTFAQAFEQRTWNIYQTFNFSGSSKFGYKIELPSGTHGITPPLSLSYNSYLANNNPGWAGAGWDIPQSYVQTNTNGTFSLFLNGAKH